MTKRTLKALQDSIAHWQRLATGTTEDEEQPYAEDCALCGLFLELDERCKGCPVRNKTGKQFCESSPYRYAEIAYTFHGINSPQFKKAARAELKFLRSLLPKKKI